MPVQYFLWCFLDNNVIFHSLCLWTPKRKRDRLTAITPVSLATGAIPEISLDFDHETSQWCFCKMGPYVKGKGAKCLLVKDKAFILAYKEAGWSTKKNFLCFCEPAVHFRNFLLCCPSQRSACSQVPSQVVTHQEIGSQLWVGKMPDLIEPGTAGQQSGALPLSHHVSLIEPPCLPHWTTSYLIASRLRPDKTIINHVLAASKAT